MFDIVISDAEGRKVFQFRSPEMLSVSIEEGYTMSLSLYDVSSSLSGDNPKAVNLSRRQGEADVKG